MRKKVWLIAALLAIAAAVLYLDASLRPAFLTGLVESGAPQSAELGMLETRPIAAGSPAQDFALRDLQGQVMKLSDLRGKRVVLNFWATWCSPCKEELSLFESLYREHAGDIVFLGVNMQESAEAVARFLESDVNVTFPVVLDSEGSVTRGYNVRVSPTTYFIDERGRISAIGSLAGKLGAFTPEELRERIDEFVKPLPNTAASPRPATDPEGQRRGPAQERMRVDSVYFSPGEQALLGISVANEQVHYRGDLDLSLLGMGCPRVDCIPSIDAPKFESPGQASSWLAEEDLVMGIASGETSKAYPLKILTWHEIVNDDLESQPIVVTFCPLCNSGLVFERPDIDGKLAEFGVSGRLYKSDLVMYDRVTGSFWSQLEAAPIVGPLVSRDISLKRLPVEILTWSGWLRFHPETLVLARPTAATAVGGRTPPDGAGSELLRNYDSNPYANSLERIVASFASPLLKDKRIDSFATVIGFTVESGAKAYIPEAIQESNILNDVVGDEPVLLLWNSESESVEIFSRRFPDGETLNFYLDENGLKDRETETRWDESGHPLDGPLAGRGAALEKLIAVRSFWFAWLAFNPETELFVGVE